MAESGIQEKYFLWKIVCRQNEIAYHTHQIFIEAGIMNRKEGMLMNNSKQRWE